VKAGTTVIAAALLLAGSAVAAASPYLLLTKAKGINCYRGGGSFAGTRRIVLDWSNHYPEYDLAGKLPGYGLFARHVRGL
jgi:hypothetical protein